MDIEVAKRNLSNDQLDNFFCVEPDACSFKMIRLETKNIIHPTYKGTNEFHRFPGLNTPEEEKARTNLIKNYRALKKQWPDTAVRANIIYASVIDHNKKIAKITGTTNYNPENTTVVELWSDYKFKRNSTL